MSDTGLIIIGGGAAGMTAAIRAAEYGLSVTVIEHNDRIGRKILSTGNGRCNLSNASISAGDYSGREPAFAMEILSRCGTEETLAFFSRIGIPVMTEETRIYPRTQQASSVVNALRYAAERNGVNLLTGTGVKEIEKTGNLFRVRTDNGSVLTSRTLLLASGGLAAPKSGSDGSMDPLVRKLGHSILCRTPALVPLVTDAPYRRAVSGLRIDGTAVLIVNDIPIQAETGQLQMTDYGISGIPVFQLSGTAACALQKKEDVRLMLDFLPAQTAEETAEELLERQALFSAERAEVMLNGFLPKTLLTELCRLSGISMSLVPEKAALLRLAGIAKNTRMNVTGTRGFAAAQTTAGGVPTDELKPTLESKLVPGLFFAGEIIDIYGRCGGCNLQWAWSCGLLAADSAAAYCR